MKKNVLIIGVVLAVIVLIVTIIFFRGDTVTDLPESVSNGDVALNTASLDKIDEKIETEFVYDMGSRFNIITKRDLDNLTSFRDIIGDEHADRIVTYESMSVILIQDDEPSDIKVAGTSGDFNEAQIEFMRDLDYSTNLVIWADYKERNKETGLLEDQHWTPYLSVVPEKQASYSKGKEALLKYLEERLIENRINLKANDLSPGKLYFTVTKDGRVTSAKVLRSSKYPEADSLLIELMNDLPGKWIPAENAKGEKVDQQLVISFGLRGC